MEVGEGVIGGSGRGSNSVEVGEGLIRWKWARV